jgi:uncharacterized protein YkwD
MFTPTKSFAALLAAALMLPVASPTRLDAGGRRAPGSLVASPATRIADAHSGRRARPRTASPASADPAQRSERLSEFQRQVIEQTNKERLKAGLPALKAQAILTRSATWMARDLATHRYFDHTDSTGRTMVDRIEEFKYENYCAIGENIAMGQQTPKEVVAAWMASPGHRANILSRDYSEIGVGYVPAPGHPNQGFWVQDFGAQFDRAPAVINSGEERTHSNKVTLSLHGDDEAEAMRFSNDGAAWSPWERYRPLCEWRLADGAGPRTVRIEIRQGGHVQRIEADVLVEAE